MEFDYDKTGPMVTADGLSSDFSGTSEHVAHSLAGVAKNIPSGGEKRTTKSGVKKSKDSGMFGRLSRKPKTSVEHHRDRSNEEQVAEKSPRNYHTAIITKESSYENVAGHQANDDSPPEEIINFRAYILGNPDKTFAQFLQAHKAYDVIPLNAKFVILDVSLPVRKAFYALIYNGVRSALLWNNDKLSGMLSVTDFIHILVKTYNNAPDHVICNIEDHLISEWRVMHSDMLRKEHNLKPLTYVTGNESLFRAVQVLVETRYHRIPILDEFNDNPLYFLTHKRILRFIYLFIDELPSPSFMQKTVRSLNVGTYDNLLTVHPDTPLIECLSRLVSRNLSALPVVTKDGTVVDIYARFDAINIAAEGSYDKLDRPLSEVLENRKRNTWYKGVVTCLETDSLRAVMDKLLHTEVHGVIVVDQMNKLKGVVTLYDILKFTVISPVSHAVLKEETPERTLTEL